MTRNNTSGQPQPQDAHIVTKFSQLKELAIELGKLLKDDVAPKVFPYLAQQVETKINALLQSHFTNYETLKAEILAEEAMKAQSSSDNDNPATGIN